MNALLTILVCFLFGILALMVFVVLSKKRQPDFADQSQDLDAWICPECGFHVQAGNECVYCYTKKPKPEDRK